MAALFGMMAGPVRAQPQNLAKGRPYTLTPRPNYSLTTDADDDRQLTDGAYTAWNPIWLRPSTVGWANAAPVTIVIDLQSVQAISGVSYNTAAGTAGVEWPRSIFVLVSDDGRHFFPVADLAAIRPGGDAPPLTGYAAFRYRDTTLDTHGRYVAVVIDQDGPYAFTDEIEVLAGDPARVGTPLSGDSTTNLQDFFVRAHMHASVQRRLARDLLSARAALAASGMDASLWAQLSRELDSLDAEIAALPASDPATFTTILPLNDLHSRIFAVHGTVARAHGFPELTAWPVNPWEFIRPLDKPPAAAALETVSIAAMNGETRAGAVNISNSTSRSMTVSLKIIGLSADATDADVHLSEVMWTDTRELIPVADALLPLDDARPAVTLPAGLTRQIWLAFSPRHRAPGVYRGYLEAAADGGTPARVPVELRVLAGSFPEKTSLHLGGWDYTNVSNTPGSTPNNRAALIDRLRELGVDSPWATGAVMPPGRFDASGQLVESPQTAQFDAWVAIWPRASGYFIFVNAQDTFGTVSRMEGARFSTALGQWISFWVTHAAAFGIAPSQLTLLLVDEPHTTAQDDRVVAWARALKAAQPRVRIWEDPTYRDPAAAEPQLFDVCDVLALKTWLMVQQGAPFADFYRRRGEQGQELALYGASGPARLLDPYTYQRLQAWLSADLGATSSFFWSFSDDAGGYSWNEYATTRPPYSPFFLTPNQVISSRHSEGIREGVEDFEYLTMLRQRVRTLQQSDPNHPGLGEATSFLSAAIASVLRSAGAADLQWTTDKDRSVAERARLAIADALGWLTKSTAEIGTTDSGSSAIGRAIPSLVLTGGSFAYDGHPHPAQATATGAYGAHVPGSFVFTYTPGGSDPPVYRGLYSVLARFTSSDPYYADARAETVVTIIENTGTTIAASASASAFGEAVAFTATVSAAGSTPPGTVRFRDNGEPMGLGVTLNAGRASITSATLPPGIHRITAEYSGSAGFTASTGDVDHIVVRATPAIRWTEPANIVYGTALDTSQLAATANVPGTLVYTPSSGTVLAAGAQQLNVVFSPADGTNYETVTKSVMLLVTRATPTITAASATITYDGHTHSVAAAATGIGAVPVAGSFGITYQPGGASPPVDPGTYFGTVSFHSIDPNYSDAGAAASIRIDPAPVAASLIYPANAATNVDLSIALQWNAIMNVQAYYLYIGSTRGAKDLVNTGEILQTTFRVVKNLPDGTVYARLWTKVAGVWRYTDSTFSAMPLAATLTYPLNGAGRVDPTVPLQWTAITNVQAYCLYVGSAPGAKDLVNTGEITQTSYRVASLPAGQTVYARLWTKVGGTWRYVDAYFTTAP